MIKYKIYEGEVIYIICTTKDKISLDYEDVTSEWLKEAKSNSKKIKELTKYIYNGTSYKVDGKNVVLDYSKEEKEVAEWFSKTFGGEIYMCPRINSPEGISTPDYLFRGEKWDLKTIKGCGKNVVNNRINGTKRKTSNYIIDVTGSELTNKAVIVQVKQIYKSKRRYWVDKIIIKRDDTLIKVYIRKRD